MNSPKVMSVPGVSVFETAKLVAQRALKKDRGRDPDWHNRKAALNHE
jgi:hypothetical protein